MSRTAETALALVGDLLFRAADASIEAHGNMWDEFDTAMVSMMTSIQGDLIDEDRSGLGVISLELKTRLQEECSSMEWGTEDFESMVWELEGYLHRWGADEDIVRELTGIIKDYAAAHERRRKDG